MAFKLRRIVTARDTLGKSIVGSDQLVLSVPGRFDERVARCDPWSTDSVPPSLDGPDPMKAAARVMPPPGGTIFRILEIPPGNDTAKHKTATLDYYVILEGELYMTLDEGEVLCKAGDVIVQRSTNHGWDNRSSKPARFAEVLIGAEGKETAR